MDRRPINKVKNLDFKRIHSVMKFLDWKWACKETDEDGNIILRVPDEFDIIQTAIQLVADALERKESISTAGFHVYYYPEEDDVDISFVLTTSEVY